MPAGFLAKKKPWVILPYHSGDLEAARRLVGWIRVLGRVGTTCVLLRDCRMRDDGGMLMISRHAFDSVVELRTPHSLPDERWPIGANWMFETGCSHMAKSGFPFLWLEPDAVPMRAGWFDAINSEYQSTAKPFMGTVVHSKDPKFPEKHLNGIAVYPANARDFFKHVGDWRHVAWDITTNGDVLDRTLDTPLIQHFWGEPGLPPTFVEFKGKDDPKNALTLDFINARAVLFHRVKDSSLIHLLRGDTRTRVKVAGMMEKVSVVITNFKRAEFLRSALDSAEMACASHIVVSSSGATPQIEEMHKRFAISPCVTIVSERGDSGCNANWIAGVKAARTDWVTILHDDDLLMPEFRMVAAAIEPDIGFVLWDARRHGMGFKDVYPILDLPTGIYPTKKLFRNLMIKDHFTLSPTIGCFRREDLLETLGEAAANFGAAFHLTPTMMVGNDLLIWLRAIAKHRYFKYIKAPLTSFGHHPGSCTCDEVFNRRGRLAPIYNKVREYFLRDYPRIVHVVARYNPTDKDAQRRIGTASASWNTLYASGMVTPLHIWQLGRDSSQIGDERRVPFLKDVLLKAVSSCRPRDIVMLTNDDDVLHPDLTWHLFDTMLDEDAVCAFRQSFQRGHCPPLSVHRDFFHEEPHDWGRDLFVFRREWLIDHLDDIPDYVTGSTDWDSTLATIIRLSKGIPVTKATWVKRDERCELPAGFVYHESHQAVWSTAVNRQVLGGNIYNRELTKQFIAKHGVGWFV